jgi:hypothetical protein
MQAGVSGQDLLVALRLVSLDGQASRTLKEIGSAIRIPPSGIDAALKRLSRAQLADAERRPLIPQLEEFLRHGLKYSFPANLGAPARGIPTAWGIPDLLPGYVANELPPVWPDAHGRVRGYALEPLSRKALVVPEADPKLYRLLGLADVLRAGDARARDLAEKQLRQAFER